MVVASRRGLLFLENMVFWIFKTSQISRISTFANIWSNFGSQLQSFVESRALASNYAWSFVESGALASNYAGSYVESRVLASRGGLGTVAPRKKWRRRRFPKNSLHLARPLGHHAQGPNIPWEESLTSIICIWKSWHNPDPLSSLSADFHWKSMFWLCSRQNIT